MRQALFPLLLAAVLAGCATPRGDTVLGVKPTYLEAVTQGVPNEAALRHRIWVPALDEGFVPQGLASAGPYLYVSSYKPTPDLKANTGPCRIFRIDKATGRTTGAFDIPPGTCTHAGGLAHAGDGKLFLADTRQVFLIDVERALASGTSAGASRAVKITGELRGSFAASNGKELWIGTWTREQPKARMFRLDPRLFDDSDGQTVKEDRAVASIPVPLEAQGAAFDRNGNLWVSASSGSFGKLYRLDLQGKVQAEYAMVAGLEDLTIDDEGRLWGLSESGTRKYLHWDTRFPFVFEIDVGQLR
jgi:sugar lactone lactonase YvrE